jgi:membrane fusion protein, multidrug efflux system
MPVTLEAVGTVEAISTVAIRSQVTGQLREVGFTPGQHVRKGQLLFALDPRPFQAAIRQSEAVVARDTAQATNAKAQSTRLADLFKRGLLARNEYEAQAATAAALDASLQADQAQVEQAKLNLQYANITAPIDGRAGGLMVHPGDLVRANDTSPLVTINQLSPIYVTFSVPARYLMDIRRYAARSPLVVSVKGQAGAPGSPPSSAIDEETGAPVSDPAPGASAGPTGRGTVTFIDNAVDPSTATITLKGTFPNGSGDLWPGLFVQVSLRLSSEPHAVVVPATAVQASQRGSYVYIIKKDRTVEMRDVAVERQQGDEDVIARGLDGGEEVVTDGQLRLTPGAHVTTRRERATSS